MLLFTHSFSTGGSLCIGLAGTRQATRRMTVMLHEAAINNSDTIIIFFMSESMRPLDCFAVNCDPAEPTARHGVPMFLDYCRSVFRDREDLLVGVLCPAYQQGSCSLICVGFMLFFTNAMPIITVKPHPDPSYGDVPNETSSRPIHIFGRISGSINCPIVICRYSSRHAPTVVKYTPVRPLPSVVCRCKITRWHIGVSAWDLGHHDSVERHVHRADIVRNRKQSSPDLPRRKTRRIV